MGQYKFTPRQRRAASGERGVLNNRLCTVYHGARGIGSGSVNELDRREVLGIAALAAFGAAAGAAEPAGDKSAAARIAGRGYPSVFQAWNRADIGRSRCFYRVFIPSSATLI